jgi:hypothetical protein
MKYHTLIEQSKLPVFIKTTLASFELSTLEDLDVAYNELIHFLLHQEFYITVQRIEDGKKWTAAQTDPKEIARGERLLVKLMAEYDRLTPKGE